MTVTPTDPSQESAVDTAEAVSSEAVADQSAEQADFGADDDLGIPDDIPTADDPSSRATSRDMDNAGSVSYTHLTLPTSHLV